MPLKTIAPPKKWLKTKQLDHQLARKLAAGKQGKPVTILKALKRQRLAVVIGDPGSGKSALVNQLCWQLIEDQGKLPKYLRGRIPVRIILRRVVIPGSAKKGHADWIWQALVTDMGVLLRDERDHAQTVLQALKQKLMQPPGGLILLDGLDEVAAAQDNRHLLLQAILDWVLELPKDTRFIVTARPYAYTDPCQRLPNFSAFFLTPFDEEQREQFIEGWYRAAQERFGLREDDLKQRIPDLLQRVEQRPHLKELAQRPLLLTLISTLHASGGRLPEDRAQLYEDSVNLLLYKWRSIKSFHNYEDQSLRLDESILRTCLQDLAFFAHNTQCQQTDPLDEKHQDTADISKKQVIDAFDPLFETVARKDLFDYLQQHTGILIARENDTFAFPHRSFQEYLAMGSLTAQAEDKLSQMVRDDPLWWREVFLLALLDQRKTPRVAISYIEDLLESDQRQTINTGHRLFILAGLGLVELRLSDSKNSGIFLRQRKMIRQGIIDLLQDPDPLNVTERAEAGRVLGLIGDSRSGVGLKSDLPDIDWREIPPGQITLSGYATITVESFYLARYPVTNAQFQVFIDDPEGYSNHQWWDGLDAEPCTAESPHWKPANHPRETVSWFEAMAFCAWLSEQLHYTVQLPTEWQWQQAACSGHTNFEYPWEGEYNSGFANINETWDNTGSHNLERTSAVGIYPQGDSEQGVSDLSGNVWEWCLNEYEKHSNSQLTGNEWRVARGGSWLDVRDDARASLRSSFVPGYRDLNLGFRLCCFRPSER